MDNRIFIDDVFENPDLAYEEKIAKIIWLELSTNEGITVVKDAIESAEKEYTERDINNIGGKDLPTVAMGFAKTLGSAFIPTFFKMAKSLYRIPSVKSINQENYLQKLYDVLQSSGAINVDSLKGFILKRLVNCSRHVTWGHMKDFNDRYDKKNVDLKLLCSLISSQLEKELNLEREIKPQVYNSKVGPQANFSNGDDGL